jgi:hypothetical protein
LDKGLRVIVPRCDPNQKNNSGVIPIELRDLKKVYEDLNVQ